MLTYKDAGVDIEAGNELVRRIARHSPHIGGFGGCFPLGDQLLVASTDGVGTKLKLANRTGNHATIGIDLVAMCVNDVIALGAKPLFFLDYFATSKLQVDVAETVIKGIMAGCQEAQCALLGGETAEMPGFYPEDHYDLAGFSVGVVHKDKVIDGSSIQPGDLVMGLPSSGPHSNGYSLINRLLEKVTDPALEEFLLTPTRIYVSQVMEFIQRLEIRGIAHITGGGFLENIPRILPKGLGCEIRRGSWSIPSVFSWIQDSARVPDEEMFRTFNMGIGLIFVIPPDQLPLVGGDALPLGKIVECEGVTIS